MNKKEVINRYNSVVEEYKNENIDLTNRVNCYVCSCGHTTKTKDIDKGVTPFMFSCEKCGKTARSSFYKDVVPEQLPTIEWYRPSLNACLSIHRRSKTNEFLIGHLDHILSGGLDYRKIN